MHYAPCWFNSPCVLYFVPCDRYSLSRNIYFVEVPYAGHAVEKRVFMFYTRVGTLIVATIYLQLIQNRYMFRSFTVRQCSHQHCVQPVASDVEVVGYL